MNRTLLAATAMYLLFIVYGSLVPLELRDLSITDAYSQFSRINYLQLGAGSRADWIANILLYIPLAFGLSASFGGVRHPLARLLLALFVGIFCLALAIGVEFAQLFFPPRTVSLNDLIAETLGTLIGLLTWHFFGAYTSQLYAHLKQGSLLSAKAAIIFYAVIYIALSLFPFDFVATHAELDDKLANGHDALLLPFDACTAEPLRCGVKLFAEIAALLPLGMLFCFLPYLQHRRTVAVLVGLFLGLGIEILQVFLLSGSGQGLSVLTRVLGMGLGASLWGWGKQLPLSELTALLRRLFWLSLLPYIGLVLAINGWFSADWLTLDEALTKLVETRFLPLYYFYYTSEGVALVSLLSNVGMYLPVGLLCWLRFFSASPPHKPAPHWIFAGILAALFALIVETGKLFVPDKHADPSDVWLAFAAAALGNALMNNILLWSRDRQSPAQLALAKRASLQAAAVEPWLVDERRKSPRHTHIPEHIAVAMRTPRTSVPAPDILPPYPANPRWRIASYCIWAAIMMALLHYPVAAVWLGLFLAAYTALLIAYPFSWLIVVPALLPIMDFTLWTGRFFFDEFDLLIMATLACYFWQKPQQRLRSLLSASTRLVLAGFVLLYGISLLLGLLPLHEVNANAFSNYYSHYNSLRVGKGFIWGLALIPLLQLTVRRYRYAPLYLGMGLLLGLTGVAVFAVIERAVFTGLFDFVSDYRINALFSTMHAGGGHIESYLMLTLPFLTLMFVQRRHRLLSNGLGILLFSLSLYTLLVTFSRGGYIGFVVGLVVLLITLLLSLKQNTPLLQRTLLILPLLVISLAMTLPVLRGSMIQQRFDNFDKDHQSRTQHWRDALSMRDDDWVTRLFGMGLGSYPRTFFWLNNENTHPATYEIATENGNHYLHLQGGDSLFIGQYLHIAAHTPYRLVLDLRSNTSNLALTTSLCEKSIQYSIRCSTVTTTSPKAGWQHLEQTLDSGAVGEPILLDSLQRPIQLTFYNGNGRGKAMDIDNVQLLDGNGLNLVRNGNFMAGNDFWFFAAEKHNPWHIFNFWVHLLFDQGWLGLTVFILLFFKTVYTLCRQLPQQSIYAPILLSAFSGFMVVGFVDSPFDAPRLTLLFFLLLFFALLRTPKAFANNPELPPHTLPPANISH